MISTAATLQAAALTALATYANTATPPTAPGTYLRQSAEQAEITAQTAPTPLVILYDFTTTQAEATGRTESAALTLYFADTRPGTTDDAAQHHAAVARMERLKQHFLAALDAGPLVQLSGIKATPFANFTSSELDGVGVQLTLTLPAASLVVACL